MAYIGLVHATLVSHGISGGVHDPTFSGTAQPANKSIIHKIGGDINDASMGGTTSIEMILISSNISDAIHDTSLGGTLPILNKSNDFVLTSKFNAFEKTGTLNINVKVLGAVTENIRVALYYRPDNTLVDIKLSDINGDVIFDQLELLNPNYYAVALTDLAYNALIYDKLTPE